MVIQQAVTANEMEAIGMKFYSRDERIFSLREYILSC